MQAGCIPSSEQYFRNSRNLSKAMTIFCFMVNGKNILLHIGLREKMN